MTDDIVTRLRKHHEWFGSGGQPTSVWEDAADEIERLRAERCNWFIVAQELKDSIMGTVESEVAMVDYYRLRGSLEDPRDCV